MAKRTHAEALQTKKNILAAAYKIFTEVGFVKASLSDIAREAHVTRGAIYWHFENKSELLVALVKEEISKLNVFNLLDNAAKDSHRDPLGNLKKWALTLLSNEAASFFISPLAATVDYVLSSAVKENVREKIIELMEERSYLVSEVLRSAVAQKQLPADCDVEVATTFLCALLNGLIEQYRLGLVNHSLAYYEKVVDMAFAHLGELRKIS